ncbi:UNVERIFIED_CONTAM: hypothetical protein RMT77_018960 [Armadillidium vulgare]
MSYLDKKGKIHWAIMNTYCAMTVEKSYHLGFLYYCCIRSRGLPFRIIHNHYVREFCRQLEIQGVLNYDVRRTFSWGTPHVYVYDYGPVDIIFKMVGDDQDDRERCQNNANESHQICTLINFYRSVDTIVDVFYHMP